MDCQTALKILEVARPGSADLSDLELVAAAEHVESHADCRDEFLRRQNLDRQIGQVMRDVPVPAGLKERLLLGLVGDGANGDVENTEDAAVATTAKTDTQTAEKIGLHRRTWFRVLLSAACLLAGVVVWQLVPSEPKIFSLIELHDEAAQKIAGGSFVFDGLDDFSNVGGVRLSAGWDAVIDSQPKAYTGVVQGSAGVAVYRFNFTDRRNRLVTGYVLVLPADRVTSATMPRAASAIGARPVYPPGFTSLSWSSDKLVYVCFVPRSGDGDAVEELKNRLSLTLS